VLTSLARLDQVEGALDRAAGLHARALAIREATLGQAHPLVAVSLLGLGEAALGAGRHEEALQRLERALALEPGGPAGREVRAAAQLALARTLRALGREPDRVRGLAQGAQTLFATLPARRQRVIEARAFLTGRPGPKENPGTF
jgi:tetratricopeptide (TPR) repeat protein